MRLLKKRYYLAVLLMVLGLIPSTAQNVQQVDSKTFAALIKKGDGVVLDVRTQGEYDRGHIKNSTLISTTDPKFVEKVSLLRKNKPLYVYCLTGSRSNAVVNYLSKQGYTKLYNLTRGTIEWQRFGYSLEKSSNAVASKSKVYSIGELGTVLKQNNLVLVDFHARWCAPCKNMLPIVEQVGKDFSSKLKVLKVDIEANRTVKDNYGIQAIPGFILFKDGKEVWRHTGMITKEELKVIIKKHI